MQHQQQQQHEFSYWLHTLRAQQHPAPASNASSYADTDSDSDSDRDDAEQHHFAFRAVHSKHTSSSKMAPPFARTAPMMIPQTSRRGQHHRRGRTSPAYFESEFEESAPHQSAFGFYSTSSSSPGYGSSADDVDEDDPALYQNLAYFRSQHARQSPSHSQQQQQQYGARSRSSSPQPRSSVSSLSSGGDDDDIFDMEL